MAFLKFLLVTGLLCVGVFFLFAHFGVEIPLVRYKGLEAHNLPVGIVIMVVAVALAKLWKIEESRTVTTIFENGRSDGKDRVSSTTTTTKRRFGSIGDE